MEHAENLAAEVQEIVWALVDDHVTDEQIGRLEKLIAESDEARGTYVRCMQMHADLHHLLGKQRPAAFPPGTSGPPLPITDLPAVGPDMPIPGV